MTTNCTRCESTGFLNVFQLPEYLQEDVDFQEILNWIEENDDHDVQVCDCCGDGDEWHGDVGQHYSSVDPPGKNGPYAYNGGLCECH